MARRFGPITKYNRRMAQQRNRRFRLLLNADGGEGGGFAEGRDISEFTEAQTINANLETDTSSNLGSHTGVCINPLTGDRFYTCDRSFNDYFQWDPATPWDISTFPSPNDANAFLAETYSDSVYPSIAGDGSFFYYCRGNTNVVDQIALSTPGDISSGGSAVSATFSEVSFVFGLDFNNDGTMVFINSGNGDRVWSYDLSTPYDLTTRSNAQQSPQLTDLTGFPTGVAIDGSGTKCYVCQGGGANVRQYNMSTPFDVTSMSATADDTLAVAGFTNIQIDKVSGLFINLSNTAQPSVRTIA